MKAVIDRLEGTWAILFMTEKRLKVLWPSELLPPGSREGQTIYFEVRSDEQRQAKTKGKLENLINKLQNKNKS